VLAGQRPLAPGEDTSKIIREYHMPKDYTALRERTNHYLENARAASTLGRHDTPERALAQPEVAGPLSAWSLAQVEKVLPEYDVRRYVRTQPLYKRFPDGQWQSQAEEYFVSIEELQRERFPKLEITTPERLFLELCRSLDRRLLEELTARPESWLGKKIHINLAVETVLSSLFVQFCHVVPAGQRGNICFELHRGDLFLDFTQTQNAFETLRHEGFRIAIDAITPNMLPFVQTHLMHVDLIKLNVAKERYVDLRHGDVIRALTLIPREKIIFFRCDNESALAAGIELGVRQFQGWLIDDVVHSHDA
jgi:EAL domain-containing protein (putative c-di-GMP-specific phosphodiesterase class I)